MSDITSGIRRAAAPERSRGSVGATSNVNQGDPTLAKSPGLEPATHYSKAFPTSVGAKHTSNGWHELTDVEHRAYTETVMSVSLNPGDTITLDPTRCQVYRIKLMAPGVTTIVVPTPTFPDPETVRQDAPERTRTWSCFVIIDVNLGGTFPTITGAKWSEFASGPNVLLPDGSEPSNYGGRYTLTFVYDPVLGDVIGHEGAVRC